MATDAMKAVANNFPNLIKKNINFILELKIYQKIVCYITVKLSNFKRLPNQIEPELFEFFDYFYVFFE